MRVLSGRGMQEALGLGQGSGVSGSRLKSFITNLLNRDDIKPLVDGELAIALQNPIRFWRPGRGGRVAMGYEATILVSICDLILAARDQARLTENDKTLAKQCEILMRAFAKVGIIALVDEATGYQEVRARDDLQRLLEAYISKELLPWTRRFPPDFYEELFRLRNWQYKPVSVKRPRLVGKLTNEIVYERLPDGVLEELQRKNPVVRPGGGRRWHHHRFLTEDIGNPHLEKHLAVVTALMRASATWANFKRLLERAMPRKRIVQLEFGFDDLDEE